MNVVPFWLHGYRRQWLARDVVAGLVVAGVVVPQAVAYAQIAGLPRRSTPRSTADHPTGVGRFNPPRGNAPSP